MEQASKRAIEGGYKETHRNYLFALREFNIDAVLLDPLFWQCLGKAEGWSDTDTVSVWKYYWHEFIDHLAEGKDINSFFENLLTPDNTTKV